MSEKKKKKLIFSFGSIILAVFFIYLGFFIHRMVHISDPDFGGPEKEYKYHVLVGGTREYLSLLEDFAEAVEEEAEFYDAKVELLFPNSVADFRGLNDWVEYARFVCADGLILFCNEGEYSGDYLINVHNKKVPVVVSGPAALDSRFVIQKLMDVVLFNENWSKAIFLTNEDRFGVKEKSLLKGAQKLLNCQLEFLKSDEGREDVLRQLIFDYVLNKKADVIFCLTPEETNLVAQIVIDMNLAGQIDIVGLIGDSGNNEYIEKGIVSASILYDEQSMARDALKILFEDIGGEL